MQISNLEPKKKKMTLAGIALGIAIVLLVTFIAIAVQTDMLNKLRYPLKYEDIIIKYADKYNLDYYEVCAVIRTESSFKHDAVSSSDARGLMQILPSTGGWIAEKIGMDNFEEQMLFDPAVNIEMGCWYLHYLSERFGGNKQVMYAGYNAGPNRVATWLDNAEYYKDGVWVHIPIEETREYVERVENATKKYQSIYHIGQTDEE